MAMIHLTHESWQKLIQSTPADRVVDLLGLSPGGVSQELGITRQAVHLAIHRDTLDAYRVTKNGKLVSINVPLSEIDRYRRNHLRTAC